MTNRIAKLIRKFEPRSFNIPIDKKELENVVEKLYELMFPISFKMDVELVHAELIMVADVLLDNISKLTSKEIANDMMEKFFIDFPNIQHRLAEDAYCYFENDPAAKSIEEVVLTYPGFFALCVHRIAHKLHELKVPLIPRLFSEYAHAKVGIDIHPGAKIGKNLFLDHGTGIVIGETTVVGNDVKIYQGVTLGALYLEKKLSSVKRHPTVEDNVVIYAAATILGGNTVIGRHSTIGGGAWLTKSVIPYSLVYNKVDVKIKTVKNFQEPNDFVI
ncbi:MAG TPA: serine O-acetyltransferase EpsC [Dysgonamonadaceae bacterium]|nr:serine O-acetyltransferase EpsC [Dysgonamonadaceae bacterium]